MANELGGVGLPGSTATTPQGFPPAASVKLKGPGNQTLNPQVSVKDKRRIVGDGAKSLALPKPTGPGPQVQTPKSYAGQAGSDVRPPVVPGVKPNDARPADDTTGYGLGTR